MIAYCNNSNIVITVIILGIAYCNNSNIVIRVIILGVVIMVVRHY